MKNKIRLFGIIALVAIIGFSMAGCDKDSDPSSLITFSNAAALNGKVVVGWANQEGSDLWLMFSASKPSTTLTGASVSGGSVTLSVYKTTNNGATWTLYTGNETFGMWDLALNVLTSGSSVSLNGTDFPLDNIDDTYYSTGNITFANGVVTVNLSTQMDNSL